MKTHREIYNEAKRLAKEHKSLCDQLADIENKKFGFEFASTDSDEIIDTINYGTSDYPFDNYIKEMNFYKKAFKKSGNVKHDGIY